MSTKWRDYGFAADCNSDVSNAMETVMQTTRIAVLTCAAAIALGGSAAMAEARRPEAHVLTLRLPDGQVEQIRYVGDAPPTVILAPDATAASFGGSFGTADPFAMLQRISAEMDRQEAAMVRAIGTMAVADFTGFGMMPVLSGPGVCSRSVQITYAGDGRAPRIVSRTAGDCGPARGEPAPVGLPNAPVRKSAPAIVEAKAAQPYPGLVRQVGDWQH
jgi:hypothetical protein